MMREGREENNVLRAEIAHLHSLLDQLGADIQSNALDSELYKVCCVWCSCMCAHVCVHVCVRAYMCVSLYECVCVYYIYILAYGHSRCRADSQIFS